MATGLAIILTNMAKHAQNILELARRGAKARIEELHSEIKALTRQFPDLGWRGGDKKEKPVRKRRKMSRAARKKISDAQKARWAKQKGRK
jgi:hypothetical protein